MGLLEYEKELFGEETLLFCENGDTYILNETASVSLDVIEQGGSEEEIMERFMAEYGIDSDVATKDSRHVIEEFRALGLLIDD